MGKRKPARLLAEQIIGADGEPTREFRITAADISGPEMLGIARALVSTVGSPGMRETPRPVRALLEEVEALLDEALATVDADVTMRRIDVGTPQ